MNLIHVYIEHNASAIDQTYTYQFYDENIEIGMRVLVNFAHRNCVGFVDSIERNSNQVFDYEIKSVLEVLDEEPILNEECIALAKVMAKTTISPVISCLQAMLPSKLKPKSSNQKIKMEKWVRPLVNHTTTSKQETIYQILVEKQEMKRSEWQKLSASITKKLEEMKCVEVFEKESKASEEDVTPQACSFILSEEQKAAVDAILHPKRDVICLKGVTGSGKTEVFLHCASSILAQGKQVLMLVPEISLTPLMVERVKSRFGNQVAIYHSGLNDQEKYEQYQSVKRCEKNIVVGTRSAVFIPFKNLGLIVIDEEHDLSYKQDSLPRYHARDIAIERGKTHHATVVLASATPSLETYARAIKGVYGRVEMKNRVTNQLPKVHLINMQERIKKGDSYILSNPLIEAMREVLERNEQVILLLNRRGYQPVLRCDSCMEVVMCPHCDRSLVYHKDSHTLKCHLCGYSMKVPVVCPTCHQGKLRGSGFGTQMLSEKIGELFPDKKIIRMDADTTSRKNAHQELLDAFGRHEADILLGTQMIAKGLDFENVTLVGILQGDAMLVRSDYRCGELTFDLLCQASGRSGRGQQEGRVMIQVYDENHYAIQCAKKHDYERFFQQEMQYRHLASYPPYTYLCNLMYVSKDASKAFACATNALEKCKKETFKVLGVSECIKINDEFRYRICIKSKSLALLQEVVYTIYQQHRRSKSTVKLQIDMNPLTMD